jgi:hypothetical protein
MSSPPSTPPAPLTDAPPAGAPARTPWHLWLIGVLALLWNAGGAFDYFMTKTQNEGYMSSFTPEQLEYFYGFPAWVTVFWATAVWGSVLASVLLLARKRLAVPVFLVSFVAMVITSFHNFVLANGLEMMGTGGAIFSAVIFVAALGLWVYAKRMADAGFLR